MILRHGPAVDLSSDNSGLTVAAAAALLSAGKVVAFPTETVYGLGADARNIAAVHEIFRLKGRPADHPLIVHLPEASWLEDWATAVPESAWRLAEAFWPGPLTLVLQRHPSVPDAVTGGQFTVGLRVPSQPLARALLEAFGGGVAAPSANRFGRISPTTAAHVRAEFGAEVPVFDGGACAVGLESTILDLSGDEPRLLRPGVITTAELEAVLGQPVASGAAQLSPRVSGSLPSHYAPHLPALLLADVAAAALETDAVLSRQPQRAAATRWLTLPDDPARYGQALYAALRELDDSGASRILIEAVPEQPAWAAVRDRLARATAAKPAAHQPVTQHDATQCGATATHQGELEVARG